jgi:hypothetical protein
MQRETRPEIESSAQGAGTMGKRFGIGDFVIRFLFALVLVLGTYNPSGKSYSHWLIDNFSGFSALMALAGVTLLIGWAVFLNSTFRALGTLGVILGLAFFGCVVWVMIDTGIISTEGSNVLAWIILILVAAILAVGMSWSHLRRRWSGQQDVDEIGED